MKKNDLDQTCVVDQFVDEFDEMDLIETRVREAMFMETDMAAHLRDLGVPGAKVVVESLDDDPCVSVYGFLLSADEASELIRRLDPKWDGLSYERDWRSLPDPEEPPDEKREREENERVRQKQIQRERPAERKAEKAEKAVQRAERKAEQRTVRVECKAEQNIKRAECKTEREDTSKSPSPSTPAPLSREERKEIAASSLALAKNNGHDPKDPATRRHVVAGIIEALRKRKNSVAAR